MYVQLQSPKVKILTNKKIKMKRMSMFYITRQKKANDLVKQMETIDVENQRMKLKKIIVQRKNKWRQIIGNKQLNHPKFNFLKKDYSEFSAIQSNASKQPFISQKTKRRRQNSDRVYSSSPNMKTGNSSILFRNKSEAEDEKILNKKFMEYDRIIDEKSALKRIEALKKKQNGNFYEITRRKNAIMKKTYFQKFIPDKYNFYTVNQYSAIKNTKISRSETDRQMRSRLQLSKIKLINSTIDSQQGRQTSILQQSMVKSRLRKKQEQFEVYRSSECKKRIKSQISDKLAPISLQKNINSVQY